jgi:predicted AAA+ superfamily ATPase
MKGATDQQLITIIFCDDSSLDDKYAALRELKARA